MLCKEAQKHSRSILQTTLNIRDHAGLTGYRFPNEMHALEALAGFWHLELRNGSQGNDLLMTNNTLEALAAFWYPKLRNGSQGIDLLVKRDALERC